MKNEKRLRWKLSAPVQVGERHEMKTDMFFFIGESGILGKIRVLHFKRRSYDLPITNSDVQPPNCGRL